MIALTKSEEISARTVHAWRVYKKVKARCAEVNKIDTTLRQFCTEKYFQQVMGPSYSIRSWDSRTHLFYLYNGEWVELPFDLFISR